MDSRTSPEQLAEAVGGGDADSVRRFLQEEPALASFYTDDGWSTLHLAATAEIAGLLLDAGAEIDAPNRHKVFGPGGRPLHAAVYQRRDDVVRLLLDRGADVRATDNAGWTPLHMTVANGRHELARTLLEAGAGPNARIGEVAEQQWSGQTPLGLLTVENRTGEGAREPDPAADEEMRRLLVRYGATE
jgi:ankyrin repeat protein